MTSNVAAPRVGAQQILGQSSRTLAAFAGTLLITCAIVLAQMKLREGVFEPTAIGIFRRLFLFEDYSLALATLLVLTAGLLPGLQGIGARVATAIGARPYLTSGIAFTVLAFGSYFVYQRHPLAMDEYVPHFQSLVFAAGRISTTFPTDVLDWLVVPQFQQFFFRTSTSTGEIVSGYWPAFALIQAPFAAFGLAWLVNPLIGALGALVIYRLTFEIFADRRVAGLSMLLALGSVAFTINAISFYAMSAHLLCNAVFALLILRPSPRRCAVAGLVGGLALTLHNPVPHALFAVPWILWLLQRRDWPALRALLIGYLPAAIVLGFGWNSVISSLGPAGDGGDASAVTGGAIDQLSAILAWPTLSVLASRLIGVAKLWIWAVPLLVTFALIGVGRGRREQAVKLLAWSGAATLLGYLFVPFDQGHGWGFRYFHSAWLILPVIAAGATGIRSSAADAESQFRLLAGTGFASLLVMNALAAVQVHQFIATHLAQVPVAESGRAEVAFISPYTTYYGVDLVQNDPFLRNDVILMMSHGRQQDAQMMAEKFPHLVMLSRSTAGTVWGSRGPDTSGSEQD